MAFDPLKEGAVEIFDPVAEGAVAVEELAAVAQPLPPAEAFDRAGKVWDASVELDLPISDVEVNFSQFEAAPEESRLSQLFQRYIRDPITEKTGLFPYVTDFGDPRRSDMTIPEKLSELKTQVPVAVAHVVLEAISGVTLSAADIIAQEFDRYVLGSEKPVTSLSELVGAITLLEDAGELREAAVTTGKLFKFMGGMKTARKLLGPLMNRLPVRESLRFMFQRGIEFATVTTAEELSNAITKGEEVDWLAIWQDAGWGTIFGGVESLVGKFLRYRDVKEVLKFEPRLKSVPKPLLNRVAEAGRARATGMTKKAWLKVYGEDMRKFVNHIRAIGETPLLTEGLTPVAETAKPAAKPVGGVPAVKPTAQLPAKVAVPKPTPAVPAITPTIPSPEGGQPAKPLEAKQEVFHGTDAKITGPIKPSKSGFVFVATTEDFAKGFGKNITKFEIPTDKILQLKNPDGSFTEAGKEITDKLGFDNAGEFTKDALPEAEKRGFLAIQRGNEIITRPEVLAQPTPTEQAAEIKVKGKKLHEPKKGSREAGFVSSVKEAIPEIKIEGQYVPRSTDELSIKAKNLIIDDIKEAERVAKAGSNDKSVAVASELIKHYGEQAAQATDETVKDALYDRAATVATDMASKLTELGRAVQAASILGRLTPEGQLRFAAREIQRHNEKIEKSRGGLFGLKKKVPDLTPEQTKEILNEMEAINEMEPGEAKARRFQKLQNKISALVPTSLFQKAITVWKAGLLTGLKTSGLNIFSTASNVGLETAAKIPATVIDKAISLGTGKRTVSVTMKGLGRGAVKGAKRGVDYLVTGYDERNIGAKLDYKRSNFGKGKVAGALQRYSDFVFRMLGAEDQPFYYAAKIRSLYEQAKVEAINKKLKGKKAQSFIDNLVENPTDEMVKNASKDAEAAVFQNKTALGDLGKGIQGLAGGAGEIVVPFARTPAAVAMQIINYSPVGAIKTVLQNIGKGRFDQRDFSIGLGKAAIGAIPLVIGVALYDNDMITLDFPKTEKERKLWELEGRKANSIKVGGKWRTVQSLGPQGNLLVIGGHFRRAFQESGSPSEAMGEALKGTAKSFTEQTFLQGINQVTSALSDPERSAPRLVRGLVSSVIPTIVGDVARALDPLERRADSVSGRLKAKVPGLRETLEPRITVLGEEKKATANPLEIMIDPTRPSKEIDKPVIKELRRLFDAGHSVTPSLLGNKSGFEILTPEQNTALWKRTGSIINETLTSIITNPAYKDWPDDVKVETIGRVVDAAKAAAKAEVVASQLKGLTGKDVTDKLIELGEAGLMSGITKKQIKELRK